MVKLLLIFAGSGLGGVMRYILSAAGQRLAGVSFPLGTLIVNTLGCLLIGFLGAAFFSSRSSVREEYRLALAVGLLGGFTTFSAFGIETFALLHAAQYLRAVANVLANVGLGLAAVWIGHRLACHWLGAT